MSLHYEWTLALRLRRDSPEPFLAELRFHLGLTDRLPDTPELDYHRPCLVGNADEALAGGEVQSLVVQRPSPHRPNCMGLFVRTLVLDDEMYELLQIVPSWLARWSLTQGWIGHAREEMSLHPWLNFYAQNGNAYLAEPGKTISPLDETAPAFTLRQTTDIPTDGHGPVDLHT